LAVAVSSFGIDPWVDRGHGLPPSAANGGQTETDSGSLRLTAPTRCVRPAGGDSAYLITFLGASLSGLFLFYGFEACGGVAEEVNDPARRIPKA
jgi:amino acid transporter